MKIIEEFGINPYLLGAQIVNFAILVFLLQRFLYKPIIKALEDRKQKVAHSIKSAEEIEKRLQKISEEQEKIIAKAKSEASLIVLDAKKESKELAEHNLQQTKSTIQDMLEKNKERLDLEKKQMLNEAKKELTNLVIEATRTVTKQTVTKEVDKEIVQKAIKDLNES